MSFRIEPIEDARWRLVFAGEPTYIHALEMSPKSREAMLDTGIWLVVVFPVWSSPAVWSMVEAIGCAKRHDGKFQLGVRPYDSHLEFEPWWPGSDQPDGGEIAMEIHGKEPHLEINISADSSKIPIWLVLRDGHVFHHSGGPRTSEELCELMAATLARPGRK